VRPDVADDVWLGPTFILVAECRAAPNREKRRGATRRARSSAAQCTRPNWSSVPTMFRRRVSPPARCMCHASEVGTPKTSCDGQSPSLTDRGRETQESNW